MTISPAANMVNGAAQETSCPPSRDADVALLGLLSEEPKHPWQIDKDVQWRDMRFWTDLSQSTIYRQLRALESGRPGDGARGEGRGPAAQGLLRDRRRPGRAARAPARAALPSPSTSSGAWTWGPPTSTSSRRGEALEALARYRVKLEENVKGYRDLEQFLIDSGCPTHRLALARRPIHLYEGEIRWLDEYVAELRANPAGSAAPAEARPMPEAIEVRNARVHNLQGHQPRHPARPARRLHRRLGLGQVVARLRHAAHRGPAPADRDVQLVRAPLPAQAVPARRGRDPQPRHLDRHRPEAPGPHAALHGRHGDRGLHLPADALLALRRRAETDAVLLLLASTSRRAGASRARGWASASGSTPTCCSTERSACATAPSPTPTTRSAAGTGREIVHCGLFDADKPLVEFTPEEMDRLLYAQEIAVDGRARGLHTKKFVGLCTRLERLYVTQGRGRRGREPSATPTSATWSTPTATPAAACGSTRERWPSGWPARASARP